MALWSIAVRVLNERVYWIAAPSDCKATWLSKFPGGRKAPVIQLILGRNGTSVPHPHSIKTHLSHDYIIRPWLGSKHSSHVYIHLYIYLHIF